MQDKIGPRLVVITDDDDLFIEVATALISTIPRVKVVGRASNGQEAVELVTTLSPDIVVMDIDMPVMGGVEATKLIHDAAPRVAVVIATGTDEAEKLEAALAAGAVHVIRKHEMPDALIAAVIAVRDELTA